MSISQRLKAMEKKAGIGDEALVVLIRNTGYEPGNGLSEYKKASIIFGPDTETVEMHKDESSEAFLRRVDEAGRPKLTITVLARQDNEQAKSS